MRLLLIEGSKVVGTFYGITLSDAQNNNPTLLIVEDAGDQDVVGMDYINGVLSGAPIPPPEPAQQIPVAVTMRQARLALLGAGVLATADAAIAGMTGIDGDAARIEWEYAHEVRRDAPLVAGMAAVLALTDAQIDALFVTAAGL